MGGRDGGREGGYMGEGIRWERWKEEGKEVGMEGVRELVSFDLWTSVVSMPMVPLVGFELSTSLDVFELSTSLDVFEL